MKRKFVTTTLILLLVVSFVLIGCAQDSSSTVASTSDEVIELKFASPSSPTHVCNTKVNEPWIKLIEEQTQGRVDITLYTGGALGKANESYDLAVKDIADISYGWIGYYPGRFKLTESYMLPGIVNSPEEAYSIYDVYKDYLEQEWSETKVLWLGVAMRYDLFTSDKQVKTVEDVQGLKFAVQSEMGAEAIKALGGTPVEVSATESYIAVQRGVVDGIMNPWSSIAANKQGEVTKYYTKAGLIQSVWFCVMNLKTYNSLPDDIKAIIDENSGREAWQAATNAYWNEDVAMEAKVMDQSGNTGEIYQLPEVELEKYRKMVSPIYDKWIEETTAKGLPAEDTLEAIDKYTSQ